MKFVVDRLPTTCAGCEYCVEATLMSPLGIPKQVNACVLHQLVPPKNPYDEPITVDKDKSPLENKCPCCEANSTGKPSGLITGV